MANRQQKNRPQQKGLGRESRSRRHRGELTVPILGIITCQILELEFAHLLSRDSEVSRVTAVEDPCSLELMKALKDRSPDRLKAITSLNAFVRRASSQLEVLLCVKEVGLHSSIKRLQSEIISTAVAMGPFVDAIMLGYGLCGNALQDPQMLLCDAGVPIFVPMDDDHPVDDCVGLIIGGREAYYGEQCQCAGTMFMNAGFSRYWKQVLHSRQFDPAITRLLLANYERSLLLPTEVLSEDEMAANVTEFNAMYGLRLESRPGTLEILRDTWLAAKTFLSNRR
jgi:Protein of unknown function (DUF1638)